MRTSSELKLVSEPDPIGQQRFSKEKISGLFCTEVEVPIHNVSIWLYRFYSGCNISTIWEIKEMH